MPRQIGATARGQHRFDEGEYGEQVGAEHSAAVVALLAAGPRVWTQTIVTVDFATYDLITSLL